MSKKAVATKGTSMSAKIARCKHGKYYTKHYNGGWQQNPLLVTWCVKCGKRMWAVEPAQPKIVAYLASGAEESQDNKKDK